MRLLVSGCTRTFRDVAVRHSDLLGRLLTPNDGSSVSSIVELGVPWACDNAAFSNFDPDKFRHMVSRVAGQPRLLWVAVPDVVGRARATLESWRRWEPELRDCVPLAYVLQDGQEALELPPAACYFIGGSTRWKLSECAADLVGAAKSRGAWVHMGRVNSLRRLRVACDLGCDSVDGTGLSRWGDWHLEKFCRWLRQIQTSQQLSLF